MADAITIKALQDASLDAKSLEEVVNGNEVKQVTTRKGETYPSVKKAINTMFKNGGLPAVPFATKALMTASALVEGKYAMVTDDSVAANNGLYVKEAGVWVKSAYDPLTQAKAYTDTNKADTLSKVQNTFNTKALMTASPLPDGSKALVDMDTEANNGLYVKTAGSWDKSEYDAVALAKNSLTRSLNIAKARTMALVGSPFSSHIEEVPELSIRSNSPENEAAGVNILYSSKDNALYFRRTHQITDITGEITTTKAEKTLVLDFSSSSLIYIYYDSTSEDYFLRGSRSLPSDNEASSGNIYLIAIIRRAGVAVRIDSISRIYYNLCPYGDSLSGKRAEIIAGRLGNNYINIDTVNEVVTIPYNTLLRYASANFDVIYDGGDTTIPFVSGTSAMRFYWDITTNEILSKNWNYKLNYNEDTSWIYLFGLRVGTGGAYTIADLSTPYTVDGVFYGDLKDVNTSPVAEVGFGVRRIAHRGGQGLGTPENTIPAFIRAKAEGFTHVETDILFTSDNVPVLLHDSTIDRTSSGTGNISEMTLDEVKTYDFGSWKDEKYAGTTIPTLEEFLILCRALGLKPYLELKGGTDEQIISVVEMVHRFNMQEDTTYIAFSLPRLQVVLDKDPKARAGFLVTNPSNTHVDQIAAKIDEGFNVFLDSSYHIIQGDVTVFKYANSKGVDVEVYTFDTPSSIITAVELGAVGVSSDRANVNKILSEHYLKGIK